MLQIPLGKSVQRMICPKCGKNCPDNSKFCDTCGTPLTTNQSNQQQNSSYQNNGYQNNGYQNNGYQNNGYQNNGYQNNGYQQYGYPQGGNYRVPIKARDIAVCIILSIVTCGIYGIYWLVCLVDDLNVASGRVGDTSGGMVALLTIVTCGIYGMYWAYKAGEKIAYVKQRNTGIMDGNDSVLYLILSIVGFSIVVYALLQSELNKVATLQ